MKTRPQLKNAVPDPLTERGLPSTPLSGRQRLNRSAAQRLNGTMLDIHQIRELIPHRFPMLLIDGIEHLDPERAVGIKNVTANEPFFQGHFPDFPVMPGVLIVECMAQVGAVWLMSSVPDAANQLKDKLVLFAAIEHAKFRRPVFPGDQLRIEMELVKRKATVSKMKGRATVDGKLVAEAVLMCQVAEKSSVARGREPSS